MSTIRYLQCVNSFSYSVKMQLQCQSYTTCVMSSDPYCVSPEHYFWIIPFFCGQDPWCR